MQPKCSHVHTRRERSLSNAGRWVEKRRHMKRYHTIHTPTRTPDACPMKTHGLATSCEIQAPARAWAMATPARSFPGHLSVALTRPKSSRRQLLATRTDHRTHAQEGHDEKVEVLVCAYPKNRRRKPSQKTPTEVFTCKKAKRHEPNGGVGDTWRDAQFSFHIKVFTSPFFFWIAISTLRNVAAP